MSTDTPEVAKNPKIDCGHFHPMKKGVVASSRDLSKKSFIKWSLGGSALLNPSLSNNFLQLFKSILSRNKEGKKFFVPIYFHLYKKSLCLIQKYTMIHT